MTAGYFIAAVAVMAGVTYLTRALPLLLVRRKIHGRFLRSFLYYIPYAVLAAMTIPAAFQSTSSVWSAAAGLAVALVLAFCRRSLLTVALSGAGAVFLTEWLLGLFR